VFLFERAAAMFRSYFIIYRKINLHMIDRGKLMRRERFIFARVGIKFVNVA